MSIARSRMIMRAVIRRNAAAADDSGGQGEPNYQITEPAVSCFVWVQNKPLISDGIKMGTVEQTQVIFPADANVKCDDEMSEIKNRKGDELFSGIYFIEGITRESRGEIVQFLLATLRKSG